MHTTCVLMLFAISGCAAYTDKEQAALSKFRGQVENELEDHDYMKSDMYLASWLSAKNWKVDDAVSMLRSSLKWRKENHVGPEMVEKEKPKCITMYPVQSDVSAKNGEPAILIRAVQWDFRRSILAGRFDQLKRCFIWFFEFMMANLRDLNSKSESGNVTHFQVLVDMSGFTLQQHGCLQCIPLYTSSLGTFENNYPGVLGKIYFVNSPNLFTVNLDRMKAVMTESTRKAMQVYGFEKEQWHKALLNEISAEQLPVEFGGQRTRKLSKRKQG